MGGWLYSFSRIAVARPVPVLVMLLILTNCSVPNHMHLERGLSPEHSDMNVRFRSTYYFRTFDYCWNGNARFGSTERYRDIVPQTDTIYRFRMTGKAKTLTNKVKFESGILPARR